MFEDSRFLTVVSLAVIGFAAFGVVYWPSCLFIVVVGFVLALCCPRLYMLVFTGLYAVVIWDHFDYGDIGLFRFFVLCFFVLSLIKSTFLVFSAAGDD